MQPVAQCLDMLQGEDEAYMGILLPNLWLMRVSLEELLQADELLYARPLVQALLRGYSKRFGRLFEDDNLLMATALHPTFTSKALERIAPEKEEDIENRIVEELKAVIKPRAKVQQCHQGQLDATEPRDMQSHLFNKLFALRPIDRAQKDIDKELKKAIEEWVPSKGELEWTLFPSEHREVWVNTFIKYNTPLPSSAAVERLFSTAGDVLTAKRSSLDEENFEELVFLKGNLSLMEDNMNLEDIE